MEGGEREREIMCVRVWGGGGGGGEEAEEMEESVVGERDERKRERE